MEFWLMIMLYPKCYILNYIIIGDNLLAKEDVIAYEETEIEHAEIIDYRRLMVTLTNSNIV